MPADMSVLMNGRTDLNSIRGKAPGRENLEVSKHVQYFRQEMQKLQKEHDELTAKSRIERIEKSRLESRVKKINLSTEIEKRNFIAMTKIKAKEKDKKRL